MTTVQEAPAAAVSARDRRRFPAPGVLVLLAAFALAAVVLVHYALRVHTWQPDEVIYILQSRALADHFPSALWDTGVFQYGIERIGPLYGALTALVFSHTATSMEAHKVLVAVSFASTTIPIYLLARRMALGTAWAVAAAVLAVAVPWAPLATSYLNDPVAYPTFAWAIYGCWRAAAVPGTRSDLLALVLVVLAALARSNLAVLGGALVLAIVSTELRFGERAGIHGTARRIVRGHVPVATAVGLALLYLLVRGKSTFTGVYPVDFTPPLGHSLDQAGAFIGFIAQGLVLVPVIVGSAWALRHLVVPLDRERHALAVTAVAATVLLLYSLMNGVREERYVFELAPIFTLLTVVAVARRDVPVPVIAATGLGVALLVSARDPVPNVGSYIPFAYPGQGWYQSVVRGRAAIYLPDRLAVHLDDILLIGIPLLVVAAMFLIRRTARAGLVAAGAVVCVQLALGLAAAHWSLDKFSTEAGDPNGPSYAQRSWIDEAVGPDQHVKLYADRGGTADQLAADTRFWNESFNDVVLPAQYLADSFDKRTGELTRPLPRYFLFAPGARRQIDIAGKPLATSHTAPVQLWRASPHMRTRWLLNPGSTDGWMPGPRDSVGFRTWGTCIAFTIMAPPDQPARIRWTEPGSDAISFELGSGQSRSLATTAPGVARIVSSSKGTVPPGAKVAGNLSAVHGVRCRPGA
jgi:hypothetical protein